MSNVMTISKRTASGLEEVLRTLLLDAESKVPADRLRIVGAIAEGAIVEQGSNANGRWMKFADGTLICTHKMNATLSAPDYVFRDDLWTLPHAAVGDVYKIICNAAGRTDDSTTNNPSLYLGTAYQDGITFLWNTGANSSIQRAAAAIRSGSNWEIQSCSVKLFAIGCWK